jgi:hypothetical protein
MIKIILSGQTDIDQYFKISGVFDYERLYHTPFLVFEVNSDTLHVHIIDNAMKLLAFPDETPVMGQWKGDFHSDYFQFKVGQYRQYLNVKDAALVRSVRKVIKHIGPQGGFRYIYIETIGGDGLAGQITNSSKSEAERLETLFRENNIPVEIQKESRRI